MKFEVFKTNYIIFMNEELPCKDAIKEGGIYTIEINTIEDLLKLNKEVDNKLIIEGRIEDDYPTIEIYNNYRE